MGDDNTFKGGVRHPMIIAHPATGVPALFVNADFTTGIDGWTAEESAPLLDYLYRFATRPQFTACRVGSRAWW